MDSQPPVYFKPGRIGNNDKRKKSCFWPQESVELYVQDKDSETKKLEVALIVAMEMKTNSLEVSYKNTHHNAIEDIFAYLHFMKFIDVMGSLKYELYNQN